MKSAKGLSSNICDRPISEDQKIQNMHNDLMGVSWVDLCAEEEIAQNAYHDESIQTKDEDLGVDETTMDGSMMTRNRKQKAPQRNSSSVPNYLKAAKGSEKAASETAGDSTNRKRKHAEVKCSSVSSDKHNDSSKLRRSPRKKPNMGNENNSRPTSRASQNSNDDFQIVMKEGWVEPKLGWCENKEIMARRIKELEKAKEKEVYLDYIREVPLKKRVKGVHPSTPNKLLNYSRRSWDTQVKNWKKDIYRFFGRTPEGSCRTSRNVSPTPDISFASLHKENALAENLLIQINAADPDRMSSLLSKFDIDSRKKFQEEEESTLKGPGALNFKGPVDFSNGI
uniref:SLBP_RNA_bind domain-containing protein n=1 Tax=Rhabditophanes sp. KR3021 TaxID=114890 RepID=A0AC35U1L0_9BILA